MSKLLRLGRLRTEQDSRGVVLVASRTRRGNGSGGCSSAPAATDPSRSSSEKGHCLTGPCGSVNITGVSYNAASDTIQPYKGHCFFAAGGYSLPCKCMGMKKMNVLRHSMVSIRRKVTWPMHAPWLTLSTMYSWSPAERVGFQLRSSMVLSPVQTSLAHGFLM